tara:strand:+ start:453 stop:845 length:393 start_codon:yes stop_codon:yes gene_type:complete
MNRQQVFDKVLNGLREQGSISVNEGGMCMYRGVNGMKCGIGMLIADEHYHEGLEESSVEHTGVIAALKHSLGYLNEGSVGFLAKVQARLHDNYSNEQQRDDDIEEYPAWLEHQAKDLASTFDLNYSETTS